MNEPPDPSRPLIAARSVTKRFDGDPVITDLDLDIAEGSIVGLIGPSGCGKTTTVRMLAGLLAPTEGTVEVAGRSATRLSSSERAQIGYLPQTPALFPDLSLWENLSFHASMYGLPLRRRRLLRSLIEWVELDGDQRKRVRDVSGGMQRRLALAATFVHDPGIVFLDEPTAGIDPILRQKFWEQFRSLAAGGKTMLVTTQYVGEASHCDLVGLMTDGELLMLDTPANLRRAAFDGEVVDVTLGSVPTADQLARLTELPFVVGEIEQTEPQQLRIVVDEADRALLEIRACLDELGLDVVEAAEYAVDYDEAFVRVVERHRRLVADGQPESGQSEHGDAMVGAVR